MPRARKATAAAANARPPAYLEPTATGQTATSKIARVIVMLQAEGGASLAELVQVTGWQPHTTRAALTGLRKKGHVIVKRSREGVTIYNIAKAA